MVPKLKEVQEDVDKAEEVLEEDLVVTLTVMEPKVFGIIDLSIGSTDTKYIELNTIFFVV